jgi:hypothetical protein
MNGGRTLTFDSQWLRDYLHENGGVMNVTERYVTLG